MKINTAFSPEYGTGVTISATTTSAQASLTGNGSLIRVTNLGTALVFIKVGTGTVTAAATDTALPSGQSMTICRTPVGSLHNVIAAVTASGTATVYAITGE